MLSTTVFAYHWEQKDGAYYVFDDTNNTMISNMLVDVGDNVYFLGSDGKMVTGWYMNAETNKIYFFDNNKNRNYGGMVFGFHYVDGYARYFGDGGALATSDTVGEYKNVYQDYWADYYGNLYLNNELAKDTSINRSEYYTKENYYSNNNLNNYYLFNFDTITPIPTKKDTTNNNKSQIVDNDAIHNSTSTITTDANFTGMYQQNNHSVVTGGTNYHIDANGNIVDDTKIEETKAFEKTGPSTTGAPKTTN